MLSNASLVKAFRLNSLFSVACSVILFLGSSWWAEQFGMQNSTFIIIGGVILLLFAGQLYWMSQQSQQIKGLVIYVILSDWMYVAGAVIASFLWMDLISVAGMGFLLSTAAVVSVISEWQRKAAFVTSA